MSIFHYGTGAIAIFRRADEKPCLLVADGRSSPFIVWELQVNGLVIVELREVLDFFLTDSLGRFNFLRVSALLIVHSLFLKNSLEELVGCKGSLAGLITVISKEVVYYYV
jgi:hypothetical protein